jgi:hypothetical protein
MQPFWRESRGMGCRENDKVEPDNLVKSFIGVGDEERENERPVTSTTPSLTDMLP